MRRRGAVGSTTAGLTYGNAADRRAPVLSGKRGHSAGNSEAAWYADTDDVSTAPTPDGASQLAWLTSTSRSARLLASRRRPSSISIGEKTIDGQKPRAS